MGGREREREVGGREKARWEGERKGGRREREREVRGREKGRWEGERKGGGGWRKTGGGGGGGGGGGVGGVERDRGAEWMETQRERRSSLTYTRQCGKGTCAIK